MSKRQNLLTPGDLCLDGFAKLGDLTVYGRQRLMEITVGSLRTFIEGKPVSVVY